MALERTFKIRASHELPKLIADAPSALIGNAGLTLDFLRGDAVARAGHQIHGEKPDGQFRAGFMKDRAGTWINVVAALLASESASLRHHMEIRFYTARRAVNVRAAEIDFHELGEAGAVVRVFSLEIFERVFRHGRRSSCG